MTPEWYYQNVIILRLSTFLKPRLIAVVLFNFSVACDMSCSNDDAVMTQCFDLSPVLMTVTRMPDERFFSNDVRFVFDGFTDHKLLSYIFSVRLKQLNLGSTSGVSVDPCLRRTISSEYICCTWSVHIKWICTWPLWSAEWCWSATLLTVPTH